MSQTPLESAPGLRLHALDAEDLAHLSAHAQDSILRVGDIAYWPSKRRFALTAARFDWAAEAEGRLERRLTGLHFETVTRVRHRHVPLHESEALLVLLAAVFEPSAEPPGGVVRLVFAGGAEILLDVECVEAQLADLGPHWAVASRPAHALDEDGAAGS